MMRASDTSDLTELPLLAGSGISVASKHAGNLSRTGMMTIGRTPGAWKSKCSRSKRNLIDRLLDTVRYFSEMPETRMYGATPALRSLPWGPHSCTVALGGREEDSLISRLEKTMTSCTLRVTGAHYSRSKTLGEWSPARTSRVPLPGVSCSPSTGIRPEHHGNAPSIQNCPENIERVQ